METRTQDTETNIGFRSFEIDDFSLATASEASSAQEIFVAEREVLQTLQGNIGALLSRTESALGLNAATVEQYQAARSRILDADIAQESANLVRLQILQQATTAVLAQANQHPGIALSLLNSTGGSVP